MRNNNQQRIAAFLRFAVIMGTTMITNIGRSDELPAPLQEPLPRVELRQHEDGAWRFFINGEVFPLRGAGGAEAPGLLEQLKAAGGNVVRTWGIETLDHTYEDGERYIDRAHRLGIKVIAGIWVQHERHGFDYGDPTVIDEQRRRVIDSVRRHKDHPAIITWGIGNEMEGPSSPHGSIPVLKEVEELVRLVKTEDPHRPVMTIIAFNPGKIANVMNLCPSIDILGLNSYGGAAGIGSALVSAGWTKPFAVTEFGVPGFWEVPVTTWGAPLEPTSQAKARAYYATHKLVFEQNDGHELCLGTFAFLWGWKQERTATWFGMFLPTREKLPQVDAMTKAWTGAWPSNRCPKILGLELSVSNTIVRPNESLSARVNAIDPENDPMRFHWSVVAESTARSEGGDAEETPQEFPDLIQRNHAPECPFVAPDTAGPYRLFLTIYDGRGSAATANIPFWVQSEEMRQP
jgi:hypothetical protein